MSEFNVDSYLNSLPEDVYSINLSCKNLTYIPSLKRFTNLIQFKCDYNQLTQLPELNDSLEYLTCEFNKLTQLPELNDSLQILFCSNNRLTQLPELNSSLEALNCYNNPLPAKLIHTTNLTDEKRNELNHIIKCLKRFKELYYSLKFKRQFRDWLWIKVRLPRIQNKFHPDNLEEMLSAADEEELDETLNKW